jgi:hypothetical protein
MCSRRMLSARLKTLNETGTVRDDQDMRSQESNGGGQEGNTAAAKDQNNNEGGK